MKLATLPSVCVCVCVCVREREREIERRCIFGHVFASYLQIKVGLVSQKYVSEREREVSENEKSKQTQTIQARGRLCTYLTPSRSVKGKWKGNFRVWYGFRFECIRVFLGGSIGKK